MRLLFKMWVFMMLVMLPACESPTAATPSGTSTTTVSSTAVAQSTNAPQAQSAAAPALTPAAGKATVTGMVFSKKTNAPIRKDTPIWLAQVYRNDKGDAAFALDPGHSPGFNVNDAGTFVGENIEPHEYVIVVGDPYSKYEVISETAGKAHVWDIKAGAVLDVGKLEVDVE